MADRERDWIVDAAKIRNYLLATGHPVGSFKAAFFAILGYQQADWRELERDLIALAVDAPLETAVRDEYGERYLQRVRLTGTNRRSARIVIVWIRRAGETSLRFVTAYPE